jgi:AraC-like DNA-binding protein
MIKGVAQSHSAFGERDNGHTFARNGQSKNVADMTTGYLVGRASHRGPEGVKPETHQWAQRKLAQRIGPNEGLSEAGHREFLPTAAGRSEAGAGLPERAGSENEIVLFFCVKGRGWCEVKGERYEITPGQLLIIPAKSERSYATYGERSWSLIWIQLVETIKDAFAVRLKINPHSANLGSSERGQMLAFFQEVLHALEMPCPQRLQQVSQRATHVLETLISSERESCAVESNAAGKIRRTIGYMKEHLNEPLRAATLAGIANMSLPHYFAQFKRVTGSSPIDYLIKLRMDHARRLLSETSWSVKEVAVSLGYEDPLYFSRVFKSVNQTAPTDFRARKRNPNGG